MPTVYAHICNLLCHAHQIPTVYAHICHLLFHAHQIPTIYVNYPPLYMPTVYATYIKYPLFMPISAIYYAMHNKCPLYANHGLRLSDTQTLTYPHAHVVCPYMPSTMPCTSNTHCICPNMPIYCAELFPGPLCLSTMPIYAHQLCSALCMRLYAHLLNVHCTLCSAHAHYICDHYVSPSYMPMYM